MVTTADRSTQPRETNIEIGEEIARRVDRLGLSELGGIVPGAVSELPTVEVRAPFTDQIIGVVPRCAAESVEIAVHRARRAQSDWVERSVPERATVLKRYHDLVLERQEEVLDLIQLETGKARRHAFEEVADVAMVCRYYAHNAERHLAPQRRKGAVPGLTSTWEYRQPLGVVGFITPWNYPLTLAVTDALAALMAGNGVVLKPDRQTPFTALWAVRLLQEAGLPLDLFQVVTGDGAVIGPPLLDNVDYVTFTGSTRTGRRIAREAGERLIGSSLELGGKNAMIVLEDADLSAAVDGAVRGSFTNTGQLCISIERLYVHRSLFDGFLQRFELATRGLVLGPGFDFDIDLGSLSSGKQLAAVEAHVQDALAKGAHLVCGGRHRPDLGPWFYEPTILTQVEDTMEVCREETFGPVVAVSPFDSIDSAIENANDSRYGLNASVWSQDTAAAMQVAQEIRAGTVNINEAYAATWASVDAPMGGFKASGQGRRHGAEGILRYTEAQTIAVQRLAPIAAPEGVSEESFSRLMSGALWLLRRLPGLR